MSTPAACQSCTGLNLVHLHPLNMAPRCSCFRPIWCLRLSINLFEGDGCFPVKVEEHEFTPPKTASDQMPAKTGAGGLWRCLERHLQD